MEDKLVKQLKASIWNFYHNTIGTVEHLNSKKRIYEIADILKDNYGYTQDMLISICEECR